MDFIAFLCTGAHKEFTADTVCPPRAASRGRKSSLLDYASYNSKEIIKLQNSIDNKK